jgi:hypothetical protein
VAEALAEFRGEMLILGLKSLSPEVAAALAKSQAANVWLHSVTSVSPEAAEALVKLPGHLFLTSLAELDSVPLAEKLAARPGALSFPYLTKISPEIAAALAKNERSLTLAGLTDVSLDVQEKLAETVGSLSLPNLTSLDSLPLAKKLAASFVLLPEVKKLSAEQAELLLRGKGPRKFLRRYLLAPVCGNTGSGQCAGRDPKYRQPDTGRQRSPSRRGLENAVEIPVETLVAGFGRA